MAILGIDPGKRQTWWALLEPQKVGVRVVWNLCESGHLELDPDALLATRLPLIYEEVGRLLWGRKISLIVAERFISRPGRGLGNVAEIVNLLLGILYCHCRQRKIPWMYVMPSVHKMWWERTFFRSPGERWPQLNDHEADACSLAIFGHYHPPIL
jgi:Holliday junction resolvasome RuvABC endonuclease subunit